MSHCNPFEAYRMYVSLKAHFNSKKFDYKHGKLNLTVRNFESRKDRYFFEKLSKKYHEEDLLEFMVSQYVGGGQLWIGNMLSEEAHAVHMQRMKRVQSLTYTVSAEIKKLWETSGENIEKFSKMFDQSESGVYAPIFSSLLQKKICPETFLILDNLLRFTKRWTIATDGDPVWEEVGRPLQKYNVFLKIENRADEFKKIIQEIIK